MASLSHFAVGIVTAKHCVPVNSTIKTSRLRAIFWMCLLAMLPDFDVITFPLGIPYADPLGHRGAAHSLLIASVFSLCVAPLLQQHLHISFKRGLFLSWIAITSHGLLDTLTDGGYGIALLWPFFDERYFAPWRPIPVSPIGYAFLSERGLHVFMTELIYSAPLLVYGLWPIKKSHSVKKSVIDVDLPK